MTKRTKHADPARAPEAEGSLGQAPEIKPDAAEARGLKELAAKAAAVHEAAVKGLPEFQRREQQFAERTEQMRLNAIAANQAEEK